MWSAADLRGSCSRVSARPCCRSPPPSAPSRGTPRPHCRATRRASCPGRSACPTPCVSTRRSSCRTAAGASPPATRSLPTASETSTPCSAHTGDSWRTWHMRHTGSRLRRGLECHDVARVLKDPADRQGHNMMAYTDYTTGKAIAFLRDPHLLNMVLVTRRIIIDVLMYVNSEGRCCLVVSCCVTWGYTQLALRGSASVVQSNGVVVRYSRAPLRS